jgi:hypothetical protein
VHSICAVGWGPEDHPDFIHFFFDIGNDDRIAFFCYFGAEPYTRRGGETPIRPSARRSRPTSSGPGTWPSTSTATRT